MFCLGFFGKFSRTITKFLDGICAICHFSQVCYYLKLQNWLKNIQNKLLWCYMWRITFLVLNVKVKLKATVTQQLKLSYFHYLFGKLHFLLFWYKVNLIKRTQNIARSQKAALKFTCWIAKYYIFSISCIFIFFLLLCRAHN